MGGVSAGPSASRKLESSKTQSSTSSLAMDRAHSNGSPMSSISSAQLDFLTFSATKSKGSPSEGPSSRVITEEVLLPALRWAGPDETSTEQLDSGVSSFKMVPAPAPVPSPVHLSCEKGAARSVCDTNARRVAEVIANHLDKASDPALGVPFSYIFPPPHFTAFVF